MITKNEQGLIIFKMKDNIGFLGTALWKCFIKNSHDMNLFNYFRIISKPAALSISANDDIAHKSLSVMISKQLKKSISKILL